MKPEEKARKKIDRLLKAAGWSIQDVKQINLGASRGVADHELTLKSGNTDHQ